MEEETLSLELPKALRDALLHEEQQKGHYSQKNLLLVYDKILKSLKTSLLEITLDEEASRRGAYSKIQNWLACIQRFQNEYERKLAPQRAYLLTEAGLSVEVYEKSIRIHQQCEEFIRILNADFWFAQRHALMMRQYTNISSHQYFIYIHNELQYLESYNSEIETLLEGLPSSNRAYVLAKRVEDYVWRETQLNFTDRVFFELNNPDEINQPHYKSIRDEITAYYDKLDRTNRKKGIYILSRLEQAAQKMEDDMKRGGGFEDTYAAGEHRDTRTSTAATKNQTEQNLYRLSLANGEKFSPRKEQDILSGIKIQLDPKLDELAKTPKILRLKIDLNQNNNNQPLYSQVSLRSPRERLFGTPGYSKFSKRATAQSKNMLDGECELNIDGIVEKATRDQRRMGHYSKDTATEIYEYICLKAMQTLAPVLVKEREEKKAVFENIDKWLSLDNLYYELRTNEIKTQAALIFENYNISEGLYDAAIKSLKETQPGADLLHFVFWCCFFEYNQKIRLDEGKERSKIDIPAGEFVDFYVWRETAIKNKFEMKLFKSCFVKERCAHAVRERIKNFVEQHRKRPYEEYATLIWKDPTYVLKSTGSHKKRFEEELSDIFSYHEGSPRNIDYKRFIAEHRPDNKKHCCTIF